MKILINNVEQRQREHRDDTEIVLFGRSPRDPSQRLTVVAQNFDPYFYAREEDVDGNEDYLLSQNSISRIIHDHGESLTSENLALIETPYPQDVPEAKDLIDGKTYAADVPFTNRFLIDTELRSYVEVPDSAFDGGEAVVDYRELKPVEPGSPDATPTPDGWETPLREVEPRVVTLDIEVDDRGDEFPAMGEERILSIVAHDNYTGEVKAFFDSGGRPVEETFPDGAPENVDEIDYRPNEREMLIAFRSWFTSINPDLVSGWNVDDFDMKFLLERFSKLNGLSPRALSPMGWAGVTSRGEPRIKGVTIYDLLTVYKRNSFTNLRSYKLDDVAKEELGEEKLQFEGSFYSLYEDDPERFLEYNARDTRLTARINEEAGVIEFRDVLRREVGVTFEDSYENKDFIEMMCRRKLHDWGKVGPTAPDYGDAPDSDFEGAYVEDPYTGVRENVVGIDLASLYPYTMKMLNASPETKVKDIDGAKAVGTEVCNAANGQAFTLDETGLFTLLVDDALSLKADYKEELLAAESKDEREKWEQKYNVAKTVTNSIYGVTGWERFFLYDEDVAEAVTLTGQAVIKATAEHVRDDGYEVVYGDTDSTYIGFPEQWSRDECLSKAEELCDYLNDVVYPKLAGDFGIPQGDSLWEIEIEVFMERFFQAGKKKRYAYLATWKDGSELEEPSVSISGFSSKRSDSSKLTEETEEAVLEAILYGNADEVSDILYDAAEEVFNPETYERIGIPGGMNNKIDKARAGQDGYYAFSTEGYPQDAHPRAVWNANKILNLGLGSGDKPMRIYLHPKAFDAVGRQIDVIAFESDADLSQIEDDFELDTERMLETTLLRPLRKICDAVGVDVDAAVRGQEQTGLGAFE